MKTLKAILILGMAAFIFSNCQKEEDFFIDEPVVEDPVVDEVPVEEEEENENEITECVMTSVLVREKALIKLEYANEILNNDSEPTRITLFSDEVMIAEGTFEEGDNFKRLNWRTEDGIQLGKIDFNDDNKPFIQRFRSIDGTRTIERTLVYEDDKVVKMTESNIANGSETISKFTYNSNDVLESIKVVKDGRSRPDKSKVFGEFDENPNPFAEIGMLLLDFPEFFNNMFWPTPNNPVLIDDGIKGETSYDYQYNEIGLPINVKYRFTLGDTEIVNVQSADYNCR